MHLWLTKIYEYLKIIQYEAMQSPTEKYLQEIPKGGEHEISNRTDLRLMTP